MIPSIKRIAASLLAGCTLISFSAFNVNASISQKRADDDYGLLQSIIDLYVETSLYETDRETLINQMLYNFIYANPGVMSELAHAALQSNDPYSAYHPASSGFLSSTNTSYGIVIEDSETLKLNTPEITDGVYITDIIENSNADFAGLLPGDRLVSLDGINVEGLTMTGIKYLLAFFPIENKNPEDSPVFKEFTKEEYDPERYAEYLKLLWNPEKEVVFGIERTDEHGSKTYIEINVSKGISQNKDVFLSIDKEFSIATIEIVAFDTENVVDEFLEAFEKAKAADCKRLIIDMRDNPGGYFDAAYELASLFTKGEKVMFYVNSREFENPQPYISKGNYIGDAFQEYVVIINSETASAAELFAYTLKQGVGATIVGEQSFGKAVGQAAYTISNGDVFTITTLEILKADKTSYNGIGIAPDFEVPLVPKKYEFPTGLSHFNHQNYTTIQVGVSNDATLALEQRYGILGIMRESAIDGFCDASTEAANIAYKYAAMANNTPTADIDDAMVSSITYTINKFKDKYILSDSQMDVAKLYLRNHSRGYRLAKECRIAVEKYEKALAKAEEESRKELEKLYREESKAREEAENSSGQNETQG